MLKGFYLTLLMGPTIPAPAPRPVIEALNSVQVTITSGQRNGFQLSFNLSKKSLINQVLLPSGLFDPKIRVIIVVTVNGIPNVLIDGIIIRQELAPSNELGQSTLTVTGEDLSLLMDLVKPPTAIPYPALTAELIVGVILAKYALYGIIPFFVPSLFPNPKLPIQQIPSQQDTDLNYINELAKNNGYVFYIEPGPAPGANIAYWGPEIRIGVPQPALNINMDAHTNVDSLSFSLDGSSREQVAIKVQEPITKLSIPIPLPDISLLSPPLALKQAPALKYKFLEGAAKLSPPEAAAQALSEANKSADAVTASGQLSVSRYGRILKARQLVGVRGAGVAYDGLYYVKSVTHNLNVKNGEYKQSFTMARNGLISLTPVVVP
ncbi:hypothetical protein JYQ62_12030 [Nostoc sp. UHCC 0702]|nr:hypothetical protein JYQ62_12030 [Nostoc sp. UHCC 0702]